MKRGSKYKAGDRVTVRSRMGGPRRPGTVVSVNGELLQYRYNVKCDDGTDFVLYTADDLLPEATAAAGEETQPPLFAVGDRVRCVLSISASEKPDAPATEWEVSVEGVVVRPRPFVGVTPGRLVGVSFLCGDGEQREVLVHPDHCIRVGTGHNTVL